MIDTSAVPISISRTATYVGDISCGGLTELTEHKKLDKVQRVNEQNEPLFTDPRNDSETTEREHYADPVDGNPPQRVSHQPIMDQPTVEFAGQVFDKYQIGGGTFTAPLNDDNNRTVSRGNHSTGELPAMLQQYLITVAVYVRLLYADAKGIAYRKPGATVAPYVAAIESQVAADFGFTDPHA